MAPTFDLQAHSIHSDGELPAAQVVALAKQAGVKLLSLTDHDTVDGVAEALAAAQREGIACVPGTELSSIDADHGDVHILGYLVDHTDARLRERLTAYRADREGRADRMATKLQELGFELDETELDRRRASGEPIGRPHIAQAAFNHPANAHRLRAEGLTTFSDLLVAYLIEGAPAFVTRTMPTVPQAIEAIHDAGGLAVWAHPFAGTEDHALVRATLDRYQAAGIDGVEAFYRTHTEAQTRVVAEHDPALLLTGSADFHGPNHPEFNRFLNFDLYGREPRLGPIGGVGSAS